MGSSRQVDGLSSLVGRDTQGPYLIGGKCISCGRIFFPKQPVCPQCTGQEIEESPPLSRRGKLYTYTVVHQKPPDYGGPTPYIIGRVQLPEGVFILAQIKAAVEDLRVGMDMELVIEAICSDTSGDELEGYKFQPVPSEPENG